MAYTYTADLGDAQDIAQEAFARAWRQWTRVSRYDNPVAWVRHVAVNLARSRWRRLRLSAAHLVRQQVSEEVPGVNPDHVAVVAALRKLPRRQREAVVLHHMMDLPVSEVAEHFDVPEGTVKSWLHRGRHALAEDLRLDVRAAIRTPAVEQVQRSSLVPRIAVAVVLALALSGVGYLVVRVVRGSARPVVPAVSPSPTPSPSPSDPMAAIDWARATIRFDLAAEGCARGELRFEMNPANRPTAKLENEGSMVQTTLHPPAIGDLDGDGRSEAVLGIYCLPVPGNPLAQRFMVVSRSPDGVLNAIAITPHRTSYSRSLRIEQPGTIVAQTDDTQERWRLAQGSLVRVGVAPG